MKLYLAAIYTTNIFLESNLFRSMSKRAQEVRRGIPNILESYHYVHKETYVKNMRRDKVQGLFLDSGAFSSFSLGVNVNIDEFITYIKETDDIFAQVSVLDAFDGSDKAENALKTWQNQNYMEKRGVSPLPCFHFGEPIDALLYYVKNYDHITLGGMVPIPNNKLEKWLDEIWSKYLCDSLGAPKIKVHGFGMTSPKLMAKYPWYSVDSSSWVQVAMNGSIYIPGHGTIAVSKNSPQRFNKDQHFDTLPKIQQDFVLEKIEAFGFDYSKIRLGQNGQPMYNELGEPVMTGVKHDYKDRWSFNMLAYQTIGQSISESNTGMRFSNSQEILF